MRQTIDARPAGIKLAMVSDHERQPGIRGEIIGWSAGAARRNRDFLASIDPTRADGIALAYTLTVRDTPEDAKAWAAIIEAFRKRLQRMGAIRDHWVVEWQKRGAPHLHGFAYFQPDALVAGCHGDPDAAWPEGQALEDTLDHMGVMACDWVKRHWLDLTRHLRTTPKAQHVMPMHAHHGWIWYVAKHASRGADHYQRQRHELPSGWQKSGRLWGKGGDWPTVAHKADSDPATWFRLRRVLRRYGLAQARTMLRRGQRWGNRHQVESARRALVYHRGFGHSEAETPAEKRKWSELRGSNVAIPLEASARLIAWARDHDAAEVTHRETIRDGEVETV